LPALQHPLSAVRRKPLALGKVLDEDSSIESSSAARSPNMQRSFVTQALSFSLATLMTLVVLVGIHHQAQPDVADQQLAQVLGPRA
jgi:hypothetical protein